MYEYSPQNSLRAVYFATSAGKRLVPERLQRPTACKNSISQAHHGFKDWPHDAVFVEEASQGWQMSLSRKVFKSIVEVEKKVLVVSRAIRAS